ncbi:MAG: GAF domain-containing protein [Nostoc sp.]
MVGTDEAFFEDDDARVILDLYNEKSGVLDGEEDTEVDLTIVPILIPRGLWGLLAAHHCESPHYWSPSDIEMMQTGAQTLATAPYILES